MEIVTLSLTTNAAGAGTVTSSRNIGPDTARVLSAVEWVDGTLADGGTAVLSVVNAYSGVDKTLLTLGSALAKEDGWYYPVSAVHTNAGSAYASYTPQVINGDLRLVVTAGGSVTTCAAHVYLE